MTLGMTPAAIIADLTTQGFAHVLPSDMRAQLLALGFADWDNFAASWHDLGVDMFMADGGRYRRRRFAAYSVAADGGAMRRKPHQPHYQSRDYNTLNGGIARWFLPLLPEIAGHPALLAILALSNQLFTAATPAELRPAAWHVELHQFRIETGPGIAGQPTPEGMHRDGVDWVLVLLVQRHNIASGITTIHDHAGTILGSFTLTEPLDCALVDDDRVYHGVTPVHPIDPALPAFRDVLVATFRRE